MSPSRELQERIEQMLQSTDPASCDYLGLIGELVRKKDSSGVDWQGAVERLYERVRREILENTGRPVSPVQFGTSGWRGILGKDLFCISVAQVCSAIATMYRELSADDPLSGPLGVADLAEVRRRGCVIGFDNRFGGRFFGRVAAWVMLREGIKVYWAGETTTGVLSAAVMQLGAAFSINFTPSHNPLEYGGLKFNGADAGPAAAEVTRRITARAAAIIEAGRQVEGFAAGEVAETEIEAQTERIDAFSLWVGHVRENREVHGLDYDGIIAAFAERDDLAVVIDSVHGASRLHMAPFFKNTTTSRLVHLRGGEDVTFGGVAPEPSSVNMLKASAVLQERPERLKLGAIIDPDGDRIRFTDGTSEISMNQFGAMAYHFLHEHKHKRGLVAKTVATSNLANSVAEGLGEEVYEPRVGFKEFKPVIDRALVCFEESDGITVKGHTPEKDGYIGLLLALDLILSSGKNLSDYLHEIEERFGYYFPERDGITVSLQGKELADALAELEKYGEGAAIEVDGAAKTIARVIAIDGRKMIFSDGSWLMIRPSGTEPKVRFYVESRTADGTAGLVRAAKGLLKEVGVL